MMKVYNLFYIVLVFTALVIYYAQAVELDSSQDEESDDGISVRNGRFLVYTTTTTTTKFTQIFTQYLSVYR